MAHRPAKRISIEQETASNSILQYFWDEFRWVILLAQMQSGKTDTYMFVAFELLRERNVKNVMIFGGFQDKELVEQLKDFMPSLKLYRRYMEESLHLSIDEREDIENMIMTNIKVLCGSELTQAYLEVSDTLFIWDESHFAQNKINRPSKFMGSVNISADGDTTKLEGDRNNYVLSVSATPYSEISDTIHEDQSKKIVKMTPGEGYIGVGKLLRNNQIIGFKTWEEALPICLVDQLKNATPKYSVVRLRGEDNMEKAIQIAHEAGIDYEIYDGEQKALRKKNPDQTKIQFLSELANAPARHKVVFIRGMLRMGKRIPKTHISFVMETSKNALTDVILQGLLGRMNGYYIEYIKIFVSEKLLKIKKGETESEIERYIRLMEDESQEISVMPHRGCNLKSATIRTENDWFTALPIVIQPADLDEYDVHEDPEYEESEKDSIIKQIKVAFQQQQLAINNNGQAKTEEILEQVMTISPDDWSLRNIAKVNGTTLYETYIEIPMITKETLETQGEKAISSFPGCGFGANDRAQLNIWNYNTNKFAHLGLPKGTIVLHARTKTASPLELLQAAIPKTTNLEVFTSNHEDGEVVLGNGAYSIHAPVDTWNEAEKMQKYIENMIRISHMEIEGQVMPRCITSNQVEGSKWQGILVTVEVLKALEKNGDIYKYIKDTYDEKLKVTRISGKTPEKNKALGQCRLAKIGW